MGVLIAIAIGVTLTGTELPTSALEDLDLDLKTVLLIVAIAPVMEEIAFRSWLSGRPGFVVPLAILCAGGVAAMLVGSAGVGMAIGLAALALALVAASRFNGRAPWEWYRRHFRWFYYAATLIFAAVHLFNFEEAGASFAPLVVPQLISGAIFGFARINYGLWSAIALHAAHNAIFVATAFVEIAPPG